MKILITGGAGYIGSILTKDLLEEGHLVTVFDNFMYNQTPFLDVCYSSNFKVIRGDVTNTELIKKACEDAEIIIPLACLTGAPLCNYRPGEAYNVTVSSIEEMLKNVNRYTKIIYPTTNSGYGIGSDGMCTENTALKPISTYGKLKVKAEELIMKHNNSISFRLATAFGVSPRMRLDLLVNDFVYRAITDRFIVLFEGHFRRNYIHVRDISNAFRHAIKHWDEMKNNVYNLGLSEANLTKRELCETIQKHLPNFYFTEATIGEDPDKRDYIVSNEKLEKTGWKAQWSLDRGIQELIKAYQIIKRNQYANI